MKKCAVGAKVEHVGETVMNRYCAVIVIKVPTRLTPSELGFTKNGKFCICDSV